MNFKLGKRPAIYDNRTLMLGNYLAATLPPPPVSVDYGKAVKSYPMYLNDKYGDCTIAAVGHMIQTWTANAGKEINPTDAQILAFYKHFTTPGAENGCNMLQVLKYWKSTGMSKDKITAYAALEPKNTTQMMDAVNLFGGAYIGVALPDFAVNAPDMLKVAWVVPASGATGKNAPDHNNGHCINAIAYDSRNLYVVTWGIVKAMSWQFYQAYADESYVVLSQDFLNNNKTPEGFYLAQLEADLKLL